MTRSSNPSSSLAASRAGKVPGVASGRGFSLIELVVAMLIVGVLTALALPTYQNYVARGNRAGVKAFMSDVAQRQESFRADRKRYARTLNDLGYGGFVDDSKGLPVPSGTPLADTTWLDGSGTTYVSEIPNKTLYKVSLVQNPTGGATSVRTCLNMGAAPSAASFGTAWAVLAEPLASQSTRDYRCAKLCLNGIGRQGVTGQDGWQVCWRS